MNSLAVSNQPQLGLVAAVGICQYDTLTAVATALAYRSAGVEIENFVVRGCKGIAVNVTVPSTAVSTTDNNAPSGKASVRLRNITFVANNGVAGVALRVGQNASTRLDGCVFQHNKASESVLQADSGTTLKVFDCNFASNSGTALVFNGSNLNVSNSSFVNNGASSSALWARVMRLQMRRVKNNSTSQVDDMAAVDAAERDDLGLAADAGAIRVAQDPYRQRQDGASVLVTNTSFIGNVGGAGGAVFLGAHAMASIKNCTFEKNAANWRGGGAIFASRDACLSILDNSTFLRNTAQPSTW